MGFLPEKKREKEEKKKGQVTIFIIIAIIIVAVALVFFLLRGSFTTTQIPASLEPVYSTFLECVRQDTQTGIGVLQSQGGYIELPAFEPGSQHMPFSSQLDFLGNPVPYWYYVSGNNIQREQVPTKSEMEEHLGDYVAGRASDCSLQNYYEQGFEISLSEATADSNIKEGSVEVNLNMDLNIQRGGESVTIRNHKISVNSRLGSLYDSARKVYDYEQKNLFLEEYAIDTLRLYAPVDGVEITCSPKIWVADEVFDDLQESIEVNTFAIKNTGSRDDYFNVELPVSERVRFLNSREWPNSFEVSPADGNLLVANPVGNQQGLGIIGFCYVPYHFVYSVKYPVMVQVYSGEEIFQFPMAVIIQGNNPREPLEGNAVSDFDAQFCQYKNTEVDVRVRDKRGNPVQAEISYECFENKCSIGQTSASGTLSNDFPQCINGFVSARASGYKEARFQFSTVSSGSIDVIMDRLYPKQIQLKLDGINYNGDAIIYFSSDDLTQAVAYPEQREVQLGEGQYRVQVYIFRNASLNIGAKRAEQCIDVTRPGVLGIFGFQEEKCFEINIPAQVVSQALAGGGTQNYYILESELTTSSGILEINARGLPVPDTIEKLQDNYVLFDSRGLGIIFR